MSNDDDRVFGLVWVEVTERLEKIACLRKICFLYKYFCANDIKEDWMGVLHGINTKSGKGTPNVSGKYVK